MNLPIAEFRSPQTGPQRGTEAGPSWLLRVEALTGAGEKKLMSDYWGSMIKEGKDPKLESYS